MLEQPEVTIIMPIRNERDFIESALDSALGQDLDVPFEVVVADGMSEDGTREILARRAATEPRLRVVDNPARGTPQALNRAIEAARGRYVVRLDGHSLFPQDYARRMVDHLRTGRAEAAGGRQESVWSNRFGAAVAAAHNSRFGIGNAKHHYATEETFVDHVAHGAYVTERVRALDGFDETFVRNQDYEFDFRYGLAGGRLLLDPSVSFTYQVRDSPRRLARQYYQYGYWRLRSLHRHPSSFSARWLVPPTLVAALATGTLASATRPGRLLLGAASTAYTGALVLGARSMSTQDPEVGRRDAALALATMHLSWGAGFLVSATGVAARGLRARLGR